MVTTTTPSPEHIMSANKTKTVTDLCAVVKHASKEGAWVAVVVPTRHEAIEICQTLPAIVPDGSQGGGRTVILPGGGRVSVVPAVEPVFIPDGTPFGIYPVGWDQASEKDFRYLATWRERAGYVLDINLTRDEARAG